MSQAEEVTNIMNDLKPVRTISEFIGLFGLHDNMYNKKYKGASLKFWVSSLLDLHSIVELPTTSVKLLQLEE